MESENHPLKPFLPENARLLMLGSFPPSRKRWSMEFYYPNWMNDMWRVMGLCFFGDSQHFCVSSEKRYDKEMLESFLCETGIALSDTACQVTRLKGTASDADLRIDKPMDIAGFLRRLPKCEVVATTGGKAAEELAAMFHVEVPVVGGCVKFDFEGRSIRFWRMPSTSRAYPLPLQKKTESYSLLFQDAGLL